MLDTCAGSVRGALERQGITNHNAARPKRVSQRFVGVRAFVSVGLRENDVERDGGRPEIPQTRDEIADDIATPGPLADRRQAAFVHVHNHDLAAGRMRPGRANHRVVDAVFEPLEELGPVDREPDHDKRRQQTSQKDKRAARVFIEPRFRLDDCEARRPRRRFEPADRTRHAI